MSKQPKSGEKKSTEAKTERKTKEQPKVEASSTSVKEVKTVAKKTKKGGETPKTVKTEAKKKTEKPKIVTHGATPAATVSTVRSIVERNRLARGFSLSELRTVGLDVNRGRKLGLRVDPRRGTELSQNVEALKNWIPHADAVHKKKSSGGKVKL